MLTRKTPLRRKAWLRPRSRTSKYRRRERDVPFMKWVKRQPCAVRADPPDPDRMTPCTGRVEADHLGERGLGQKASDDTCAPLCSQHHRERTDHAGAFFNLTRDQLRLWRARALHRTTVAWAMRSQGERDAAHVR